jgi:hypothetical protein
VVVSNIYAMPEQYGDAALYFDPLDVEKMAKAIGRVWADDELVLQMKKRGYEVAAKNNQSNFNRQFNEMMNKEILENI